MRRPLVIDDSSSFFIFHVVWSFDHFIVSYTRILLLYNIVTRRQGVSILTHNFNVYHDKASLHVSDSDCNAISDFEPIPAKGEYFICRLTFSGLRN